MTSRGCGARICFVSLTLYGVKGSSRWHDYRGQKGSGTSTGYRQCERVPEKRKLAGQATVGERGGDEQRADSYMTVSAQGPVASWQADPAYIQPISSGSVTPSLKTGRSLQTWRARREVMS